MKRKEKKRKEKKRRKKKTGNERREKRYKKKRPKKERKEKGRKNRKKEKNNYTSLPPRGPGALRPSCFDLIHLKYGTKKGLYSPSDKSLQKKTC